ncbi:LOW QUALITY PROTEIN: ras GTPase-activating protein-binding protein 2-like [Lethenteron reissneri]|uniref:LOW QUALITY PROTEIN: ras GTPase-activating protein-binding protein 2-like n=1 Tax=Lethenteron reissneri TaxID=7753 RepID=UPI002AB6EC41|nr:LOW QUALITY PROTEIN: ras GTPase-activating protein-binding protein 2-like [Lethenteron reissneri]
MVMERPSPQLVGREFVRQYYTLLNQAPDYLHRFYGKNSTYVHGGLDANGQPAEAVIGQAEIHKKVMSLGFRDCHTKIRHVDALASLGDGVVVQVMGELSNAGQPMRRFMQTFVLAPEGSVPNKFYVHNDMFRYQDEVFLDSDTEAAEESGEEVEEGEEEQEIIQPEPPAPAPFIQDTTPPSSTEVVEQEELTSHLEAAPGGGIAGPGAEPESPGGVEGNGDVEGGSPEEDERVPDSLDTDGTGHWRDETEGTTPEKPEAKPPSPCQPVEPPPAPHKPPETNSWASVTSKNLPPGGVGAPSGGVTPYVMKAPQAPLQPASQPRVEVKTEQAGTGPVPLLSRGRGGGPPRDRAGGPPRTPRPEGGDGNQEFEPRRPTTARYPDSQQIFVGNLPHDIEEAELRDFFMTFGHVVDLRINTKSSGSGSKLPNFGFVIFQEPDAVQSVLASKPVLLRGEVRLNVEEKKSRVARDGEWRSLEGRRGGGGGGPGGARGGGGPGGLGPRGGGGPREGWGGGASPRGGGAGAGGFFPRGGGRGGQGDPRFPAQRR